MVILYKKITMEILHWFEAQPNLEFYYNKLQIYFNVYLVK
jgi:hypothetical protein